MEGHLLVGNMGVGSASHEEATRTGSELALKSLFSEKILAAYDRLEDPANTSFFALPSRLWFFSATHTSATVKTHMQFPAINPAMPIRFTPVCRGISRGVGHDPFCSILLVPDPTLGTHQR